MTSITIDRRNSNEAGEVDARCLPIPTQRVLIERAWGPAIRIWMTPDEFDKASRLPNGTPFPDFTAQVLSDGRVSIWRAQSQIDELLKGGEVLLVESIKSRILTDEET